MTNEHEFDRYISLATFRTSGTEVRTPVWFADAGGGTLYVMSAGDAGKVKRLRRSSRARIAILDTLGVMVAGSPEDTAARTRTLIAHRRGADEATVAGTALRASIEDAALVNAVAAHALDYDDVHASLSGHPSVPVLPAAL